MLTPPLSYYSFIKLTASSTVISPLSNFSRISALLTSLELSLLFSYPSAEMRSSSLFLTVG